MSRVNRPAGLNRTVLALTGLVLLAGGGFAVATYFGWLRVLDPASPLVPGTAAPPVWVFWVTVAVAVVVGLLCLRWLAAQAFRTPKSVGWRLEESPEDGTTTMDSSAANAPVATDIEGYEGVKSASAWVSGSRDEPELYLLVTAEQDVDITALRHRIASHAVARLRQALEVETLPVRLELRFTTKTTSARAL
ncbi:alkaline shock response membrane anchor protein AmaP [Amycolatopsis sp. NPDC059021]|uniref:alkaline shock response membrane anchor protein AmaP n=1 Tax=Amycolatopsis sp. NPDC059021 TaxID=3346704 RepID=UPI00366BF8DB